MNQRLIAKYEQLKQRDREELKKSIAAHDQRESRDTRKILAVLAEWGVDPTTISENGYSFHFIHKGLVVNFVNQTERFCVDAHRAVESDVEREMVSDHFLKHTNPDLWRKIAAEYDIRDFIVTGGDAAYLMKETMRRLYGSKP